LNVEGLAPVRLDFQLCESHLGDGSLVGMADAVNCGIIFVAWQRALFSDARRLGLGFERGSRWSRCHNFAIVAASDPDLLACSGLALDFLDCEVQPAFNR